MDYLQVRNWREFQHYRDRNPPWIKLHFALLSSPDWVTLDDASRVLAVACMLIASRHAGLIPIDKAYVRRVAYLNQDPDFKPLIDCGFLEPASTTLADASTLQANARPEERQRRDTKPLLEQSKGNGQRRKPSNACAFANCTSPGTKSRSTNGAGPWYCTAHYSQDQAPKHIVEHLEAVQPEDPIPF